MCRSCRSGASFLTPGNSAEAAAQQTNGAFGNKEVVKGSKVVCHTQPTSSFFHLLKWVILCGSIFSLLVFSRSTLNCLLCTDNHQVDICSPGLSAPDPCIWWLTCLYLGVPLRTSNLTVLKLSSSFILSSNPYQTCFSSYSPVLVNVTKPRTWQFLEGRIPFFCSDFISMEPLLIFLLKHLSDPDLFSVSTAIVLFQNYNCFLNVLSTFDLASFQSIFQTKPAVIILTDKSPWPKRA